MTRRIVLENEDHEWLVDTLDHMVGKAKANISIWLERLPQLERVRDALYAAQPGFEELFPDDPEPAPSKTAAKNGKGRAKKTAPVKLPVGTNVEEKKPRAKRGERLATLPKLCPNHPTYGALRSPRTDCDGCWSAYEKMNGPAQYARARTSFDRKARKGRG